MHTVSRAEALDYPGPVIRRCGVKFSYDQSPHGIDAVARAAGENPVEIETELGIEEKNGYRGEQRQVQKKPSQNLGGKRKKNEETSFSRSITLQAGDLIFTGTPAGVGSMQPGDFIRGGVDGVGQFTMTVGTAPCLRNPSSCIP